MVPEAKLTRTDAGLVPEGDGWFVLNARDAVWEESPVMGSGTAFEARDNRFSDFGVNIVVLGPGQPNCMYHGENEQEDFLVLSGECLLLVEGEERPLKQWDFVHCPRWTEHVFVGAGDGPCAILMVGGRLNKGRPLPGRGRRAQARRRGGDGNPRGQGGVRAVSRVDRPALSGGRAATRRAGTASDRAPRPGARGGRATRAGGRARG